MVGARVVGVAGPLCAGKDTLARFLVGLYGPVPFSFGSFIRLETVRRGLELTRENLIAVGGELRTRGELPRKIVDAVREAIARGYPVIVTDVRLGIEVKALRELGATIVGVWAPAEVRYRRLVERKRSGDVVTWERFVEISKHPTEVEAEKIARELADIRVENVGSLKDLRRRAIEIGRELGLKKQAKRFRILCLATHMAQYMIAPRQVLEKKLRSGNLSLPLIVALGSVVAGVTPGELVLHVLEAKPAHNPVETLVNALNSGSKTRFASAIAGILALLDTA